MRLAQGHCSQAVSAARADLRTQGVAVAQRIADLGLLLKAAVPQLEAFSTQATEHAHRQIGEILRTPTTIVAPAQRPKHVRNVCIYSRDQEARQNEDGWVENVVRRCVKNGASWTEVVSPGWADRVALRAADLRDCHGPQMRPRYEARITSQSYPTMNFIIVEYMDGSRDLWFGWPVRHTDTYTDAQTFHTRDRRLVTYFEAWFEALLSENRVGKLPH